MIGKRERMRSEIISEGKIGRIMINEIGKIKIVRRFCSNDSAKVWGRNERLTYRKFTRGFLKKCTLRLVKWWLKQCNSWLRGPGQMLNLSNSSQLKSPSNSNRFLGSKKDKNSHLKNLRLLIITPNLSTHSPNHQPNSNRNPTKGRNLVR